MSKLKKIFGLSIIFVLVAFMASCGGDDKKIVKKGKSNVINNTQVAAEGPISVKRYDVPAGADPSVPAEQGGEGFTGEGWETFENYVSQGSPNAKKGGEIIMTLGNYPSNFRTKGKDHNSSVNSFLKGMVYEVLLGFDSRTMRYYPGLATHWKFSEDKMTYWFRINPDARFSDGKPVTADDVVASYDLFIDEGILDPYTNQHYRENYERPVAESKYIVKVKQKLDNWRLFLYFAASMEILPAHHLNKIDGKTYLEKYQWDMLPGSGAYIVDKEQTVKGQSVVLRRRSDYWAEDAPANVGIGNFDKINIQIVRDEVLNKEKFKKGEVDFYQVGRAQWWVNEFDHENPEPDFPELRRGLVQKRRIYNMNPKGLGGIAFNTRKAPFDDIKVRKAFSKLWNIDQLNDKLFYNEYARIQSRYPGSIYANPDNPVYNYDPDEANKLLDEAGWKERNETGIRLKNGQPFVVEMAIDQSQERIFTPYQEDLRKAGIQLDLKISDPNTMFQMVMERRFSMRYQNWTGLFFPNPYSSLHSSLADKDHTNNVTGFKNKRVDELCVEYDVESDPQRRIEIIKEIDKIFSESYHYAYGWYAPHTARILFWNKFGMPESVFPYTGDWRDIPSYWWYDEEKAQKLEEAKNDKNITFPQGEITVDKWNVYKN